jgi:hypothetical protein
VGDEQQPQGRRARPLADPALSRCNFSRRTRRLDLDSIPTNATEAEALITQLGEA